MGSSIAVMIRVAIHLGLAITRIKLEDFLHVLELFYFPFFPFQWGRDLLYVMLYRQPYKILLCVQFSVFLWSCP